MRVLGAVLAAVVLLLAGCSGGGGSPRPAADTTTSSAVASTTTATTPTTPPPDQPITYTVEPYLGTTVTQIQFGGRMCPCMKINYNPDGFHNQQGADAIDAAVPKMKVGDTLMGFSLGVQVISLYLSQTGLPGHHPLPVGVHVLLAGDTWNRNNVLLAAAPDAAHVGSTGQGIPLDIATDVTMVVNEYDGWSDSPDVASSPNYSLADSNAVQGTTRLHYYANADVNNPANVVEHHGNITTVLIPTQNLPNNDWMRIGPNPSADALDAQQRPLIDSAYTRQGSTPEQRAAAGAEQVPLPNPTWNQQPEPVLAP